jgi:hypothetical protein
MMAKFTSNPEVNNDEWMKGINITSFLSFNSIIGSSIALLALSLSLSVDLVILLDFYDIIIPRLF